MDRDTMLSFGGLDGWPARVHRYEAASDGLGPTKTPARIAGRRSDERYYSLLIFGLFVNHLSKSNMSHMSPTAGELTGT